MPDIFQAFTLEEVVRTGIATLVVFAGLISILFVIWGGFLMIISAGNEEKVKAAVNHMRHAFLGVLLIVVTLFIFPTFLDLLGVEYGQYMRPAAIFDTIGSLSDRLFGQQVEAIPLGDNSSKVAIPDNFSDF